MTPKGGGRIRGRACISIPQGIMRTYSTCCSIGPPLLCGNLLQANRPKVVKFLSDLFETIVLFQRKSHPLLYGTPPYRGLWGGVSNWLLVVPGEGVLLSFSITPYFRKVHINIWDLLSCQCSGKCCAWYLTTGPLKVFVPSRLITGKNK